MKKKLILGCILLTNNLIVTPISFTPDMCDEIEALQKLAIQRQRQYAEVLQQENDPKGLVGCEAYFTDIAWKSAKALCKTELSDLIEKCIEKHGGSDQECKEAIKSIILDFYGQAVNETVKRAKLYNIRMDVQVDRLVRLQRGW